MTFQYYAYSNLPTLEDKPYLPGKNKTLGFFTKENKVTGDLVYLDYALSTPLLCPFHKEKGQDVQMVLDEEKHVTCNLCMTEGRPEL